MNIRSFIKSNFLYLIWFCIYFSIAWYIFYIFDPMRNQQEAFLNVLCIYIFSIGLALSPVGEIILRYIQGAREVATREEKDYLLPIFSEVYEFAKEQYPKLNKNIKIYIIDEMYVNACAIGRNTIAVTKGAIETFTEEELKGVLSHEFGHIYFGHTKALLLSTIGNLIFSIIVFIASTILRIINFITYLFSHKEAGLIMNLLTLIAQIFLNFCIFTFVYISNVILSLNSRSNEFQADTYAFEIGYGENLVSALYLLQKITISSKMSFSERLKCSHPHTSIRIQNLERLLQEQ